MSSLFLEVQSSLQDTLRSSKRKILIHGLLGVGLPKIHGVLTVSPPPGPAHLGRGWEQSLRFSAPAVVNQTLHHCRERGSEEKWEGANNLSANIKAAFSTVFNMCLAET